MHLTIDITYDDFALITNALGEYKARCEALEAKWATLEAGKVWPGGAVELRRGVAAIDELVASLEAQEACHGIA